MNKLAYLRGRIRLLASLVRQWHRRALFGFVQGGCHVPELLLEEVGRQVGVASEAIVRRFESEFAQLVGPGHAISFASARMGFFSLLTHLKIGRGDEVVLLGSTCSVMVNAVLRAGATPVFSDIDPDTFGSSAHHIAIRLSGRTRMIVAQHSFGIPCDIEPIVELARQRHIFLLEDCAITLGSTVDGVSVGNFGDAALFSTDHSKPINTLTGGLVYSTDGGVIAGLQQMQFDAMELPRAKQDAIWDRYLKERVDCCPSRYGRRLVLDLFAAIGGKLVKRTSPFLDNDSGSRAGENYPYPAKLPAFLAMIGLFEVRRWADAASIRKKLFAEMLAIASRSKLASHLPKAYWNTRLDIIPLRFVWSQADGAAMRDRLADFVHVAWTWFMQPVISTREPLECLGYINGMCPISERIGAGMVNLPCNLSDADGQLLVAMFHDAIGAM